MGWFKRLFAFNSTAIDLIRHLQKMLAYHQLMTEVYNRAIEYAGNDPAKITSDVQPALSFKWRLLNQMDAEHSGFTGASSELLQPAYSAFTHAKALMRARRVKQDEAASAILGGQTPSDFSHLDAHEFEAANQVMQEINSLIRKIGMRPEEWIRITGDAYNTVRGELDLRPFSYDEFGSMVYQVMSSKQVSFFAEYNPKNES